MPGTLEVVNHTQTTVPMRRLKRIFRVAVKKRTLNVSVAYVGDTAMRTLNRRWRGKNYPTNVLAFPLENELGEIVINVHAAMREAHKDGVSLAERIELLFVHGLAHLMGHDHKRAIDATRMQQYEHMLLTLHNG